MAQQTTVVRPIPQQPRRHSPWPGRFLFGSALLVIATILASALFSLGVGFFSSAPAQTSIGPASAEPVAQQQVAEQPVQESAPPQESVVNDTQIAPATIPVLEGNGWELFKTPAVGELFIDPESPTTFYIREGLGGTGWIGRYDPARDVPGKLWGVAKYNIWKSEDDGESWRSIGFQYHTFVVDEIEPEKYGYTNVRVSDVSGPMLPDRFHRIYSDTESQKWDALEQYYRDEVRRKLGLQDLALGEAVGDSRVLLVWAIAREENTADQTGMLFLSLQEGKNPIKVKTPEGWGLLVPPLVGASLNGETINLWIWGGNRTTWRLKTSLAEMGSS